MSPRALVYLAVAVVAGTLAPVSASALILTGLSVNGGAPVVAGTPVPVVCVAVPDGSFAKDYPKTANFSAAAGSLTPASVAFAGPDGAGNYSAASTWTPPATAGTVAVTCQGLGTRYPTTAAKTLSVNVVVSAPPVAAPQITAFSAPPSVVMVSSSSAVSVSADDAAATFAWTATGGTFADPAAAATTWVAPDAQGSYTLTVTVTNAAGGSVKRSAAVGTVLSLYQGSLSAAVRYPRRVAATAGGDLLVVDDHGTLFLLTKRGDVRSSIPGLRATAVTVGAVGGKEVAFVATRQRGILEFDPATGKQSGGIPFAASAKVSGLAYDAARDLLWAAVFAGNRAIALRPDGTAALVITQAEGRALRNLADVALDAARNTLWVAEKDGLTGNRVHAYDAATGAYLRSMVTSGGAVGQVADTGGIALDPSGRVFVTDTFNGTIQVMSAAGSPLGAIGTKGTAEGSLLHPRSVAFMANGDLAIANAWFNRVERFGSGADLATCEGDTDCDGLPDDWEDANFGPTAKNDASNGLDDPDGDGLNNREELALGTNPNSADTDGDGYSDKDELLAGFNPLDGTDHQPVVAVASLGQVPPGLVRLSATATNAEGCAASWTQLSGPSVTLRDAATFAPSFIGRTAAVYRFQAVAVCAAASSAPAVAQVEVVNVSPMADAGRVISTSPSRRVTLDASFSSDANGGALTYSWEQKLGPVTSVSAAGAALTVQPRREGYYEFALTATDRAGASGTSVVGVVVADDDLPTVKVQRSQIAAAVGSSVTLDASVVDPDDDVRFLWRQVEPQEAIVATTASASVTIPSAGRFVFEVTATEDRVTSPPARVVVLAGEGGALPTASASAPRSAAPMTEIALDGAASVATSGALAYSWRQVGGPAAGLSRADAAVASAVPFSAGVYLFELTVTDVTGAVSAPATVRIDVTEGGRALPAAVATAPASAQVDEMVVLNGRGSTGASRYRWSQVAGPWVDLDCTRASPHFKADYAGIYVFELVVDDGRVRSAPATVTVNVSETEGN